MRPRRPRVPGFVRGIGTVFIVVLPILVAAFLQGAIGDRPTLPVYVVLFLLVGASAQLGLIIRRWGNINLGRLLFDLGLFLITGGIAYGVVEVALRRGGGPVDPFLMAVIMAYIVATWSGQHP